MEENIEKHLEIIKGWILKQPHLPQNINNNLLRRFLHSSKNSIEQSKYLIDLYFSLRSQAPEIFDNRDPDQPELQEIFRNIDNIPLPHWRDGKHQIFLNRLRNSDSEKYNFVASVKAFFMFADVRMAIDDKIPEGDIPIFDMKHFTLKHVTRIVLPVLKKYMMYSQEAHPITLKEIHVLNVPSYVDRLMVLIRPLMKTEVAKILHFHLPNSETLYEFIPKELLPEEYGGSAGTCDDIKKIWLAIVSKNRDYLMDQTRWRVDESKRVEKNNSSKQLFGMEGSFRSLSID